MILFDFVRQSVKAELSGGWEKFPRVAPHFRCRRPVENYQRRLNDTFRP